MLNLSTLLEKGSAVPLAVSFAVYFVLDPILSEATSAFVVVSILVTAAIVGIDSRGRFLLVLAVGLPGLALSGLGVSLGNANLVAVGLVLSGIQVGIIVVGIVRGILTLRDVSANAVLSAACGYLLLGLLWSAVYGLTEIAFTGSFTDQGRAIREIDDPLREMVYYSYVTLTTLGYGDVVPQLPMARSLAVLEAVSGQLYMAILVAGLVGRYASQKRSDSTDG